MTRKFKNAEEFCKIHVPRHSRGRFVGALGAGCESCVPWTHTGCAPQPGRAAAGMFCPVLSTLTISHQDQKQPSESKTHISLDRSSASRCVLQQWVHACGTGAGEEEEEGRLSLLS